MAKIQPVWALDIGQAALKALKLVPGETPHQVTAEAFDYIEYPKILSQPDADPEQLVREALETFLDRNELKGSRVAISVPGQAGLVKFIKLPPVEKKRIPDIVKFEARQQIPFALDEVVWAYQQIGGDDDDDEDFMMAEVGLFAMKRDQIARAILPFRVAGIEVDIVQMGPIALYNFVTFDVLKEGPPPEAKEGVADAETDAGYEKAKPKPPLEKGASVVLIDIGADNTDLIITDGVRIWQRNVPIGGNHFTRALTKELKQTFAKAEHLKRNATKAPDPRSIFTAMRGVFNDFASEVNRSIGFYQSTNKGAKIAKVIGLGNGFKLPGLQKFLQQNLSHEVEKLDGFARLVGEDVTTAPQFQENLMSFAVTYGLAVQGLGKSGLSTNLLPPEIEQVRMIRAKKPWALAASALLMLGFSALFLGDYRVLAKVSTEPFKQAVSAAKRATETGAKYDSDFAAAKTAWQGEYDQGKSLVGGAGERAVWPTFLKTLNVHLPDPIKQYGLDPNKPTDQPKLDRLRVHVDAIKPVWRTDVAADWFNSGALPENMKNLMHPYDRANPPAGKGWIIQIVGHHYNPYPTAEEMKLPEKQRTMFGPYRYLTEKIMPSLMTTDLRLYGISNVALGWMATDKTWTTEKAGATNGLSATAVPILDRASAPAAAAGGMPGAPGGPGGMPGGPGMTSASAGMMPGMMPGRMPGMMPGRPGMMPGGPGMMPYNPMMNTPGAADAAKKIVTQTRTDFLIQFVWQPPLPEDVPKTKEELQAKREELSKKLVEAQKNNSVVNVPKESDVEAASLKQSAELTNALTKGAAAGPPPGAALPGAPPAPAPPAAPR